MARDARPRFSITPWPPVILPAPGAVARATYRLGASGGFFWGTQGERSDLFAEVPVHEVYLDLIAVDLDDETAIKSFVDHYGTLEMWRGQTTGVVSYLGLSISPYEADAVLEPIMAAREEALREADEWWLLSDTLEDFRYGATSMRDLVAAWRWVSEGRKPKRWECPLWEHTPSIDIPETRREAASMLDWHLSHGLVSFHPQLVIEGVEGSTGMRRFTEDLPLYSLCCLELFNHIVEKATYRRCANETCGRLFVRQSGRAEHGQHRTTGVKYCSAECARAQAQRQYRRRKANGGGSA
jgi:hypothetical protein